MSILESIRPIWKVFAVGLLLGAGLPALFAVGIHFSAVHTSRDGSVVGAAILFGLAVLVDAKHVLPAVGLG